jgi:hypothetical protein
MDNHSMCETCGLVSEAGEHGEQKECIKAMRLAMIRQRQSAERQGMEMSVHFLRALEELSIRPDVGFRYTVMNHETGCQEQLAPQQVSGVFASLLRAYREQSDFKPEEVQQKLAVHWSMVAGKLGGLLHIFMERYEVEESDKLEAMALLEGVATDDGSGPSVAELQAELKDEQRLNVYFEKALSRAQAEIGDHVSMELKTMMKELLKTRGQRRPDPGHSESPQS